MCVQKCFCTALSGRSKSLASASSNRGRSAAQPGAFATGSEDLKHLRGARNEVITLINSCFLCQKLFEPCIRKVHRVAQAMRWIQLTDLLLLAGWEAVTAIRISLKSN